jgi:acyl-CoA synthetase (NDP forming)
MNMTEKEYKTQLERGFNPKVIAVVGAARHNQHRWLKVQLPFMKEHGKLYNVNINEEEWAGADELGIQNFKSLLDIPENVDYVTISVPRNIVPFILKDCVAKKVAVAHIFAAGFDEVEDEVGHELARQVQQISEEGNLLVIGPNCMGLYNAEKGIRQDLNQPALKAGYMGYISQSGSQAIGFTLEAAAQGVPSSMCFSMGNGLVLDIHHFVDYLGQEPNTKVIGIYCEGPRDPKEFFQSIGKISSEIPVLVWKVGQTEDSARATSAHTGTPYINQDLWRRLMYRSGAIPVDSLEEMIDTSKALVMLRPCSNMNIGILAATGGHSTEMANVFSKEGFRVVPLTEKSYERLGEFFNLIGGNYVNPIQGSSDRFNDIVEILGEDDNIDVVAVEVGAGRLLTRKDASDPWLIDDSQIESYIETFNKFNENSKKTLITVVTTSFPRVESSVMEEIDKRFSEAGIPIFYSFQRAARSLRHVVDRHSTLAYLS